MVDEIQNEPPVNTVTGETGSDPVAPTEVTSPESEPVVLDLTTSPDDAAAGAPDVDELETRLADLQSAMDQLQAGDLDGAEAAVAALEQQLAASREPRQ